MSTSHMSLAQILSAAHQAASLLTSIAAQSTLTASQVSDEQVKVSEEFKSSIDRQIGDTKNCQISAAVVAGLGSFLSIASGLKPASFSAASTLTTTVVAPTFKAGAGIGEAVFANKLGEDQEKQADIGGVSDQMGSLADDGIDGSSDLMTSEAGILRNLSAMINNQKQASGA